MSHTTTPRVSRIFRTLLVPVAPLLALLALEGTQAQDPKPGAGKPVDQGEQNYSPVPQSPWEVTTTPDGFTIWKKTINSGCSFSDHNYALDVPADPNDMSDISYQMTNYDVDYNDPQGCEG